MLRCISFLHYIMQSIRPMRVGSIQFPENDNRKKCFSYIDHILCYYGNLLSINLQSPIVSSFTTSVKTPKFCILPTHCIYAFFTFLTINSEVCSTQHNVNCFYKRFAQYYSTQYYGCSCTVYSNYHQTLRPIFKFHKANFDVRWKTHHLSPTPSPPSPFSSTPRVLACDILNTPFTDKREQLMSSS